MPEFNAPILAILLRDIQEAIDLLHMKEAKGQGGQPLSPISVKSRNCVEQMAMQIDVLPLSDLLRIKIPRLAKRFATDKVLTISQASLLLKELWNDILTDMLSMSFLVIPANKKVYYEQNTPPFGKLVADRFPKANKDIEDATRCFALEQWTASVFLLMRVLETGLHQFALELNVPMSSTIELENWQNIIDQIEKRIRESDKMPKGSEKSELLQRYSQIAINFRYFKDAWRNHVSHSRATYDEREALTIWNHVKAFMEELSKNMEKEQTS